MRDGERERGKGENSKEQGQSDETVATRTLGARNVSHLSEIAPGVGEGDFGSQSSAFTNGTAMMEGGEVREGEREGERDSARCVGGREKKTRLCKQANRKKQKILDLGP